MKFARRPALPRPDFAPRQPRARPLAALALLATLGWLAHEASQVLPLRAQLAQAAAERARWEDKRTTQLAQQAQNVAPPVPEETRQKAWQVDDSLRFGWGRVLADVEAATPEGVQWLQLEVDRERRTLRVEGLADNISTALETSDRLATQVGLAEVVLARLASPDAGTAKGRRFEITGRISGAAP